MEAVTDQRYFCRKIKGTQLKAFLQEIKSAHGMENGVVFVCIGTDRSTGDSLGPLVGTYLVESGFANVIGTLEQPCDASNMRERLGEIEAGRFIIAIDACLGQPASVGWYQVSNRPLEPGKSVGKTLPPVGDCSIAAIVNVDGVKKYWILQNTSLHRVRTMAKEIAAAIIEVFRDP